MADDSTRFRFDLDADEAIGHLSEIKEAISKIGSSGNLDGLISGFNTLLGPLAIAGSALLVLKEALDLTLEGEVIQKIHNQFEALASQAGISAKSMEEDIEKAVGKTVDMEDALKSANKAIIQLGPSAAKIPQLFELAKNSAKVFGGEITDNFDALSQAIASGNTRALKHMGIIIDSDKALRDYARGLGVTASELSQTEKQQALMNAVLEKGEANFKNIKGSQETATMALAELKKSFKEFNDAIALFMANTGLAKTVLDGLNATIKATSSFLIQTFGTDGQMAADKVSRLTKEIESMEQALKKAQAGESNSWIEKIFGGPDVGLIENRISKLKEQLSEAQKQKDEFDKANPQAESEAPVMDAAKDEEGMRLRREKAAKFQSDLLQLYKNRIDAELAVETDAEQARVLAQAQRSALEEQYNARIQETYLKGQENKELTAEQASLMIMQLEEDRAAKVQQLYMQEEELVIKVYDNQLKAAKNYTDGFLAASRKAGAEAQKDLADFGKQGQVAFNAMNSGAAKFFRGLGEGSQSASDLMRGFMFGALADIADAQGQMYLKAGLAALAAGSPGGGIQVAEGGALLALAGFLRSQAGGGSSAGSSGGGGASGSSGGGMSATDNTVTTQPMAQEKGKSVSVNFMGDYFETQETKQRLVELIRQETDATSYTYQQIPVR